MSDKKTNSSGGSLSIVFLTAATFAYFDVDTFHGMDRFINAALVGGGSSFAASISAILGFVAFGGISLILAGLVSVLGKDKPNGDIILAAGAIGGIAGGLCSAIYGAIKGYGVAKDFILNTPIVS